MVSMTARTQPSRRRDARKLDARPTVLLVEDDDEMRYLVATVLREQGFDVTEAADGGQFLLELARTYVRGNERRAFDLIVSDIRMKLCSGLQVVEALRRAHWSTPVIFMTGFSDVSTRRRVDELDAVLLTKPFEIRQLEAAVERSMLCR